MSTRTIVEMHALETTAAANLNRDDTGSPKTMEYGGVTRARVSSQAWKRPIRQMFDDLLDPQELGIRSKKVVEILSKRIAALDDSFADEAPDLAEAVLSKGAGIKLTAPRKKKGAEDQEDRRLNQSQYLLFLGNRQYDALAQLAVDARRESSDLKEAQTAIGKMKKQIKQIIKDDKSIDVALFGRMVADDTDLNIDAASQFANAFSVQAVDTESDFFTAVDDIRNAGDADDENGGDSGAAMLGEIEFNAATYYRFADVDANRLYDTLGDVEATAKAIGALVKAFVMSMPQGKSSTFAQGTLPDLVVVNIRDTQAVNMSGAFLTPVKPNYVENATKALVRRSKDMDDVYGVTPVKTWVVRIGDATKDADALAEAVSLRELVDGVEEAVSSRLSQE